MKLVTFRNFFLVGGLAFLVLMGASYDARAKGRGRGDSKEDKKCAKFVNCHDASEGRVDGRGPRRGNDDNDNWNWRRNRRGRDDNDSWNWRNDRRRRDSDNSDNRWSRRSHHRNSDNSDNRWGGWSHDRNRDSSRNDHRRRRDSDMNRNVSWTRRGR
jgi:hypothetical protein